MVRVAIDNTGLSISFAAWESFFAGRRSHLIPASSITGAVAGDQWISEFMGLRSGLVVSGFMKIGVWRTLSGTRRLLCLRRGVPTLRVKIRRETDGQFDEVLIGIPDAHELAAVASRWVTA
ncbi:MAG: hypothetical protein WAW17_18385 [Rhodococcus sp. (in: high G+C Gram-positive bacteria)]|uniref:hypothetical protein n=1 Tax=Rhodococcus sp. TaxID=1831 RepID=UPI003BB115A4